MNPHSLLQDQCNGQVWSINEYGFVKYLLGAHDRRATIQTENTTMQLQTIVQNLIVDDIRAKPKVVNCQDFETLLLTATGTEQPPSRVFMKARSAIVASTVSLWVIRIYDR